MLTEEIINGVWNALVEELINADRLVVLSFIKNIMGKGRQAESQWLIL
jgi:hypothetical protein